MRYVMISMNFTHVFRLHVVSIHHRARCYFTQKKKQSPVSVYIGITYICILFTPSVVKGSIILWTWSLSVFTFVMVMWNISNTEMSINFQRLCIHLVSRKYMTRFPVLFPFRISMKFYVYFHVIPSCFVLCFSWIN